MVVFHRELIAQEDAFAIVGIGVEIITATILGAGDEGARRQEPQALELRRRICRAHHKADVLEFHVLAFLTGIGSAAEHAEDEEGENAGVIEIHANP